MSAHSKSPQPPNSSTRRAFVGGVGAVVLGCASDDGTGELQTSSGRETPNGSGTDSAAGNQTNTPAATEPAPQPMGTPAQSADQPTQPTNLQNGETPPAASTPTTPAPTPAQTPGSCTLYPQQTEGPYYVAGDMLRADIREGKSGTSLTLDLLVLSADGCSAIANAAVDIWHCDAGGVYSGYQGQLGGLDTRGEVFLRGTQLTGADGKVQFQTIYPGWYPGRTTHIHFKVHLPGNREVTSQLYFDEALNSEVYNTDPYAAHGQKDTSNMADLGRGAPLTPVTRSARGYAGSMTITVAG